MCEIVIVFQCERELPEVFDGEYGAPKTISGIQGSIQPSPLGEVVETAVADINYCTLTGIVYLDTFQLKSRNKEL